MVLQDTGWPRTRRETEPQPFRREPLIKGNSFARLMAARVLAEAAGASLDAVITDRWPSDRALDLVARATSAPAMTSVAGWAAELAQKLVSDALDALAPMSAGVQILRQGMVLSFDNHGLITVPGFVASAASGGFVSEGSPIPVRQLVAAAAQLSPHKLASIAALTEEMINSSNAETMISDALLRSAGIILDGLLFDANAADAARPAGLRNGIAALIPSASTTPEEAFLEDIATLFNQVATVGGNGPYCLVTSPGRAMSLRMRIMSRDSLVGPIYGTSAVGNDIIAIATAALVSAFSPDPDIETSNAATLVMNDAPGAAGTTGSDRSLYQTASVAVKMRWPVSWALRDPLGIAWLTPAWK